ncbi:MAG: TolC family protein, partial [Nitrospinota bacterium]
NTTQIAIAKNTREISDHEFATKVMEVLTRTQKTYWSLVALNKELKVREESLERAKDFLERIELQVKVGVLAPIEITAAKAVIAVREEALIEVRHGINNTQDELKALLNRPDAQPGSPVIFETTDEPVYKKVALRLDLLKEMAFENRRDYMQASLAIDSKRKELEFNKNQLKWSFNLTGGATLYGTRGGGKTITDTYTGTTGTSQLDGSVADAGSDMASGRYYDLSVGLVAEYPLYNRKAKSNVAKNVMELSQAETRFMSLRQGIEVEVLSASRAVKTAEQKIHASRASSVLAEKKLEAETKKYDVGASTIFTVLEYQNDLAAAQSKEINAVTDYIKALAQLDLATGMVLKKHNVSIE